MVTADSTLPATRLFIEKSGPSSRSFSRKSGDVRKIRRRAFSALKISGFKGLKSSFAILSSLVYLICEADTATRRPRRDNRHYLRFFMVPSSWFLSRPTQTLDHPRMFPGYLFDLRGSCLSNLLDVKPELEEKNGQRTDTDEADREEKTSNSNVSAYRKQIKSRLYTTPANI